MRRREPGLAFTVAVAAALSFMYGLTVLAGYLLVSGEELAGTKAMFLFFLGPVLIMPHFDRIVGFVHRLVRRR